MLGSNTKLIPKVENKLIKDMLPELVENNLDEVLGLIIERNFNICIKNEIYQISDYALISLSPLAESRK
jgi:hypothetical protein